MATALDMLYSQYPEKLGARAKSMGMTDREQLIQLAYAVTGPDVPYDRFKQMMEESVGGEAESEPAPEPVLPEVMTIPDDPPSKSVSKPKGWFAAPFSDSWQEDPLYDDYRLWEKDRTRTQLEKLAAAQAKADPEETWVEPSGAEAVEYWDQVARRFYEPTHPNHPDYTGAAAGAADGTPDGRRQLG